MDIKISVIIPIYNMAEWIGHAIETVESQTLKEIEVICVDDGSTDNSLEMLLSYKQVYKNLIVLHQENKGAGSARNLALDYASGEYVAFLDADDYYYSDDALEYLYYKAKVNNALICRGGSCEDRDGVLSFHGLKPGSTFQKEGFILSCDFPSPGGFWTGIYCRQFLRENHICFPDLLRGQDVVFSITAIGTAGKVYCLDRIVYVYRKGHKNVLYNEKKAADIMQADCQVLSLSAQYGMEKVFIAWKRNLEGERGAMLYKYAAEGSTKMLELATKINAVIGGGLYEGDEIKTYVKRIESEEPVFLERLKNLDSVYVFGAGTVGKKVVAWLLKMGIKPTAVIVSDLTENPDSISGIPVESISAIDCRRNYVVIIATFWYLHDQIIQTLKDQGVEKVYPLDLCAFHLWQGEIVH